MLEFLNYSSPVYRGIILSILAGMATGLGALPLLFIRKRFSGGIIDASLGFAAGVMLAATAFSLVLASIEEGGLIPMIVGMAAGVLFVDRMDKMIPHDHFVKGHEGPGMSRLRKIWLFVFAIIIHNFPEGLAVGVGGFSKHAYSLAFAIGAQNIPEGLAVAAALIAAEYSPGYAVFIAFLSGLAEPVGGMLGAGLVGISSSVLPYALAFAGGAMLFVISDEVIPETHSGDHQRLATFSLVSGFILMTILDTLF
ncbi:MAG: ZIP family metal transporter [Tepidanaerobacteraceae bacterium]|jgi:ZIP family zinc transporter|nr:ZIP family metal transporter [Tepidanaerobacteraceae bacterium]